MRWGCQLNPEPAIVAACGCMYTHKGMQIAACRLHGQVREIHGILKGMMERYDRTGTISLSATATLPVIRRFVG